MRFIRDSALARAKVPRSVLVEERVRPVSTEWTRLEVLVDRETLVLIEKVRSLRGTEAVKTSEILKSALKREAERLEKVKLGDADVGDAGARKVRLEVVWKVFQCFQVVEFEQRRLSMSCVIAK